MTILSAILGLLVTAAQGEQERARKILDAAKFRGGLIVHVGCGNGRLTAALRAHEGCLIHGLETDPVRVEAARRNIRALGLYGPVTIDLFEGERLPYADNLVNLIVVSDGGARIPEAELLRALAPRGVAIVGDRRVEKPWPTDLDEWTHYLHDASGNAVSRDQRVAPLHHLQWDAGPRWCRSHETDMSVNTVVTANGRIFHFFDEGPIGIHESPSKKRRLPDKASLVGRDAFNGILLWKRPLSGWGSAAWDDSRWHWGTRDQLWSAPLTLTRRLVSAGDRLYVTLSFRACVSELDAVTGKTLREFKETADTEEILHHQGLLVLRVRGTSQSREAVMVVDVASGSVLWKKPFAAVTSLTLAASGPRVFFHDGKELRALDLKTGKELWKASCAVGKPKRGGVVCTLLVDKEVVLFADGRRARAFSSDRGKPLWTGGATPSFRGAPDVVVVNGMAWLGGGFKLYNAATGKLAREIKAGHVLTGGHHARCHRAKATDSFILYSKRGIEFIDLKSNRHMRHDWVRGTCRNGIIPANGLMYAPSNPCFCYPGVKLNGFNALSPSDGAVSPERMKPPQTVRSPAYDSIDTGKPSPADWPTYRGDNARSGCARTTVPNSPKLGWTTALRGKVSPPVVADGRIYVSEVESNGVHCLDAETGKQLWSHTTGGPVDSPPTVHHGRVLFGCTDGSVSCLRATDGKLAWRFHAAPCAKRIVSYGRLQSAWPVHGSVLVHENVVYFAAGRSSFLDGGIYLYGLDVASGKIVHQARLEGPKPDLTVPNKRAHEMDGSRNDILVCTAGKLFLTLNVFDLELKAVESPKIARWGARKTERHLVATGGFLDTSGFDRLFWMYAERWPGLYVAHSAPKAGQILVFDQTTTYGLKVFTTKFSRSPYFTLATDGCELFADDNENEPILEKKAEAAERGPMSRAKPPKWSVKIPVRARAMVLAGKTLFIAGPPDVIDPKDPYGAFEGRKGGFLWAVSTQDGSRITEQLLESPPVFDGLIAAQGKLYLVTSDGRISCWK